MASLTTEELHHCAICSSTQVQICTGCLSVYYCGSEHQLQHWPQHKSQCSGLNKRSDLLGRAEKSRETRSKSILDVTNSPPSPVPTPSSSSTSSQKQLNSSTGGLSVEEKERRQAEREKFMTRGVLPQLQQQLQMKAAAQQKQQSQTTSQPQSQPQQNTTPQPQQSIIQIQAANIQKQQQQQQQNTPQQQQQQQQQQYPQLPSNIKQQIQQIQQNSNSTPTSTPPSNTPTAQRKVTYINNNSNSSYSAPTTPQQPKSTVVHSFSSSNLNSSSGGLSTSSSLSSSSGGQQQQQSNPSNQQTTSSFSAPPSVNNSADSIDISSSSGSVKNIQSRLGQLNFQIPSTAGAGYRRSVMPPPKSAPMTDIQEQPQSQSTPTSPTNNLTTLQQQQQQLLPESMASVEQMLSQLQQITPPATTTTTSNTTTTTSTPTTTASTANSFSTPSTPLQNSSAGPASTMPAQKIVPLRTHKKNQSMPDITSNPVILERQQKLQQQEQQQQQQQNDGDDDSFIQFKERNRPKGLRFKETPIDTDAPPVSGGKQRRSADFDNTNNSAFVEQTGVTGGNNSNYSRLESEAPLIEQSSEVPTPSEQQQQQQQTTTGGKLAEKFNIIKKKAGVVSALTKTKMSEVAQKAKKSLNKEQPQTASENAASQQQQQPNINIVDCKIFGQPLPVAIQRTAHAHPLLPDLVYKSIEYLRERGTKEEGIFRLSGSASAINKLREEFDSGADVDLSTQLDQHVVSGILKLYLRQIPETLFTEEYPEELEGLRAGGNSPDAVSMRINGITALLKQLPEPNRCILHHLCSLLNIIAFEPSTKMTTVNLAIIFAPTLGCPVEVMTVLIDYYEPIFSEQTYDYIQ
ncbi:MYND-type zinc finger-containing protein [Heterostelium album PN500]|uniref:MYND-type zinc finger-containing protein n=1 Tax=Heterostelium pallidum (strain ATCC 26659 / Pp 5 / PN500) TaxID=670386 RepID=D3BJX5_HETP5|nr:MYND-type zinc finger-containing protein [Heterostelium album PN500]EFA78205.1 MYND-type zinc finger-containing protein [Heterostelium album PN500]|eukprot:XP_020430331.1 MYND-type zinc finger-containing protein [Heterostelium album PN500]